jgi:hypothetical protein
VVNKLKSGKSTHALDVQGFKHAPIINIRLEDCTFEKVTKANIVENVKGMMLRSVRINGKLVE